MDFDKKKAILIALVVAFCGVLWLFYGKGVSNLVENQPETQQIQTSEQSQSSEEQGKIYVHIIGAIRKPGVYTFDVKPRVIDVVRKAGGFTKYAVKSEINQAELVEDGTQLKITSKKENKEKSRSENVDKNQLNLNTATKEDLMTLPGIGESKAVSIISYREKNGRFKKIEDIMNITGIKSGVFNKIKDQICI